MTSPNRQLLAQASRQALDLCRRAIAVRPIAVPQIQESVLAQLEWLTDFAEGRNDDRARLGEMVFGHYVARDEISSDDGSLIDALHNAFYAASTYRRGLKIDPSTLSAMLPNPSLERP